MLAAWSALWCAILAPGGGIAWKFFVQGTDVLFTSHGSAAASQPGLHLYAAYPQLQIGPAAYAVAEVLRQIGPDYGLVAAEIVMTALGMLVIAMTQRIAVIVRPGLTAQPGRLRLYLLVAGAFFVIAWAELAVAFGHLDDCLAITCAVAAVWIWIVPQAPAPVRAAFMGVSAGLAAAAKPWAFVFLPVILLPLAPAARGRRGTAGGWAVAIAVAGVAVVTLAAWLPFFLGDPGTSNAVHYQIANMPDSALRALGVSTARTPSWDRSVQIGLGCVLGLVAIVRRRWAALILLGAGARIALDPGVHKYYTPEVMAGALLWELLGQRRPWPVWTVLAFLALNMAPVLTGDNPLLGDIRLGLVIAFTAAVLLGPSRWYWRPSCGEPSGDPAGGDQQVGPGLPDAPG
ncbi:MAG: hypothetical protein ACRDNF_11350 [Streptosporangiaceae bacterium]